MRTCMYKGLRFGASVLVLILVASLPVSLVQAQSGLSFLRLGVNAAGQSMGDTGVAHSNDAFATYWNPAGLAYGSKNLAALSHHIWVADTRTYAFSTRFQAGEGAGLGIFATATDTGDLESRERPGEPTGVFQAQFVTAGLSYGRSFGPFRAGASVKYISEEIFTERATGYAFDFGLQASLLNENLYVGAAVQNIGEMNELDRVASPLPRMLRAGVGIRPFRVLTELDGSTLLNALLTVEVSHLFPEEGGDLTQWHLGAEAQVLDMVVVRAGYISNDTLRDVTVGAGISYSTFIFGYAVLPFENGFGGPGHILTLTYAW